VRLARHNAALAWKSQVLTVAFRQGWVVDEPPGERLLEKDLGQMLPQHLHRHLGIGDAQVQLVRHLELMRTPPLGTKRAHEFEQI
jgi:hypothetical protein